MKKLLVLLFAAVMVFSLAACSTQNASTAKKKTAAAPTSAATKPATQPTAGTSATTQPATEEIEEVSVEPVAYSFVLSDVAIGQTITFGNYEQDNNSDTGKEPIEWRILDIQDGKALIISCCGLDCQPYHTKLTSVTWENSYIRSWLNDEFLNKAFSAEEQSQIINSTISNPDNEYYGTKGGNSTKDYVFLLSLEEAKQYFTNDEDRRFNLSRYAEFSCGAVASNLSGYQGCAWWGLRSPGGSTNYAASIKYNGKINYDGYEVDGDGVLNNCAAVRPALWIGLGS